MAIGFPPTPVYPLAIDSDRTLFKVFNTSEAQLASNNPAWGDEVEIVPVAANAPEIWPTNGFATISGEMFYYDAVELNGNNKIFKLKRCARNLGGKKTKYNPKGEWVRGFVVAEHHNQLVDAILALENFLETLDYKIKNLDDQPDCIDDHDCPDVNFEVEVDDEASSNCEGTVVNFSVQIQGIFNRFVIDFGDGNSTTDQEGTHTYAPNASIDPIITISNDKCQLVQTPGTRENPEEPPTTDEPTTFEIPIPTIPDFPPINIPDIDPPGNDITLPPIVFPCLDGTTINGTIPSVIIVEPPTNFPSIINFGPVGFPTEISFTTPTFSPIEFGPSPEFTPIEFGPAPTFAPIEFGPAPSFSPIEFGPSPEFTPIEFGPAPSVSPIDFGPAPTFTPIEFGPAPTFSPIEFGPAPTFTPISFGPAPTISPIVVSLGPAPSIAPINFGPAPTLTPIAFGPAPTLAPISFGPAPTIAPVNFGPVPTFPTIAFTPVTISPVGFGPAPTIAPIAFGPAPSIAPVTFAPLVIPDIGFENPPTISVDWGSVPTVNVNVTVTCPGADGPSGSDPSVSGQSFGGINEDAFQDSLKSMMHIDTNDIGIPSEIKIIAPKMPDIQITHDLPREIEVVAPTIPPYIQILAPEVSIPSQIEIVNSSILPETIEIVARDVPSSIKLDASALPSTIKLEVPEAFPMISIDASSLPTSIQVVGIPESIELIGNIPSEIIIRAPENLEVPLVYKGGPIPIQFDMAALTGGDGEDLPCFALVPCPKK